MVLELSDLAILGGGFATVIGGLWTLWKYIKSREGKPRVVAKISCRILDHQDSAGARIADIRLMVKNTGGERLTVSSIFMSVRGINTQTTIKMNGPLNQANFPISIASKRRMFPDTWGHSYVDPGQMVSYKHLTKIPSGIKVINIHGKIECPDPSIEFVTVSETIEV
jgi:hypothetical protein